MVVVLAACGSKTGLLAVDEMDSGAPRDAPPFDAFETFPCRWSYGQPVVLGRGRTIEAWEALDGAVHGSRDTVWVHGEDITVGEGRVSRRLGLGDPPPVLDPEPASLFQPSLHGLANGWAAVASDCSIGFFDDEAQPRRLVIAADLPPPCWLERQSSGFIDLTFSVSTGSRVVRYRDDGELVHEVASRFEGEPARSLTSPDGRLVATVGEGPGGVRAALLNVASGTTVTAPVSIGRTTGGFSVALDRLRPAALVLLPDRGSASLVRIPFDPDGFEPTIIATTADAPVDPDTALVTNETEALMALDDGSIAIQPLSGSEMRFLEPPEPSVEDMRIILAPGESRGGVLYSYVGPEGTSVLAFRMLVCNR
jgi:hypothetical protein